MGASTLRLGRYSLGVGDRFAHQAQAQLGAFLQAEAAGVTVTPVWNKSNREHVTVGSEPASVRAAAVAAVAALAWEHPYFVDADHVTSETVVRFVAPCDFFTLDVAGAIGRPVGLGAAREFLAHHPELTGCLEVPGVARPIELTCAATQAAAEHYLGAVDEAARIYELVAAERAGAAFVTEVSMDETESPQTPAELLVILAAAADVGIPAQTIAPKFTGRFNKGVDYVGDVAQFEREFRDDLAVVAFAIERYGLPADLKLSVHSGSDKFSIFPAIRRALRDTGAGVHVKTSGTTWLEEVIGLAEAGGEGLALAKEVYAGAYGRRAELCAPYAGVIDIAPARLPTPAEVERWSSQQFTAALRHDRSNPAFNPDLRQLVHVGYKIAAGMGARYTNLLAACAAPIARNVAANLYERHIRPLFIE